MSIQFDAGSGGNILVAPWAVIASLPFAPEIVIPTLDYFEELRLRANNENAAWPNSSPSRWTEGIGIWQ